MMKTRIIIFVILKLFIATFSFGQVKLKKEEKKKQREEKNSQKEGEGKAAWKERLVWGGNAFATFKPISIDIAPTLGYKVSPYFIPGIGVGFNYFKPADSKDPRKEGITYTTKTSIQSRLGKYVFLQVETEAVNFQNRQKMSERLWQINPQAGGGLNIPLAGQAQVMVNVMYNFNYNPKTSVYLSPWIVRIGFAFN